MATKKKSTTEVARLEIVCTSDNVSEVRIEGDLMVLTAALASLMADNDKENKFRDMISTAIQVVLFQDQIDKKEAKKKAATKKKAAPKKKKA